MASFPTHTFDENNIYASWNESYITASQNIKSLYEPVGVYTGFIPSADPSDPANKLILSVDPTKGYSLAKVESKLSNYMIDVYFDTTVTLDFTGHTFIGPAYVLLDTSYEIGSISTGRFYTSSTTGNNKTSITICRVEKPGAVLQPYYSTYPADRHLPIAYSGQTYGYMPSGSTEKLNAGLDMTAEVIAARVDVDSTTTQSSLSDRLDQDLLTVSNRLAVENHIIQGNVYLLFSTASSLDITTSLQSGTRSYEPLIDFDLSSNIGIGNTNDGIIDDSPDNIVIPIDFSTGKRFIKSTGEPIYARFTSPPNISFYYLDEALGEQSYDFTGSSFPIRIQPFFPAFVNHDTNGKDASAVLFKCLGSDYRNALTTQSGALSFNSNGGTDALKAVQANDTRLDDICKTDGTTNFTATQSYTGSISITSNENITNKEYVDSKSLVNYQIEKTAPISTTGATVISITSSVFPFTVRAAGVSIAKVETGILNGWFADEGVEISDVRIVGGNQVQFDVELFQAGNREWSFWIIAGGG